MPVINLKKFSLYGNVFFEKGLTALTCAFDKCERVLLK